MTRRLTSLAAAAVLTLSLGACVAPSGGGSTGGGGLAGGGDVHGNNGSHTQPCEADFKPAGDLTGITTGASVKATLWVRCTTPPTEHHLTLTLQHYKINGWADTETRTIDKIPPPMWQPMIVTASCVPGKWRLKWSVTGTVAGQPFAGGATGEPYDVKVSDCA